MPKTHQRLAFVALLLGGVAVESVGATSPAIDPWMVLAEVRDQLRATSPSAAAFDQSFVPSGFSTGDTESGRLYVDLPKCLRFEYLEPFPKNFLLCGDWVYTWNPGDPSGRRFLVEDGETEGIDLLRLEVESLRKRYRAEHGRDPAGTEIIRLIPTIENSEIREATVELAGGRAVAGSKPSRRLLALSYEDQGGNRTRFEIAEATELDNKATFQAPALVWLED